MEKLANVHSFETFGALDGPGIRFVVFLKGCNLQCKYCHNKDTWDTQINKQYSAEQIYNIAKKYKSYYGGVVRITFSGGEPLLQQDFLLDFLQKYPDCDVAIDTNGCFELTEKLKQIIELTNVFLVDLKHVNSKKCKELTSVSNEKEIKFIDYLISKNKRIYLRQVIVPKIHDSEEDLRELKQFLDKRKGKFEKVELLPYHNLGEYKWGKDKPNFQTPTNEEISRIETLLQL